MVSDINTRSAVTTPQGLGVCPGVVTRWSGGYWPLLSALSRVTIAIWKINTRRETPRWARSNWEYILLPLHYNQPHSIISLNISAVVKISSRPETETVIATFWFVFPFLRVLNPTHREKQTLKKCNWAVIHVVKENPHGEPFLKLAGPACRDTRTLWSAT